MSYRIPSSKDIGIHEQVGRKFVEERTHTRNWLDGLGPGPGIERGGSVDAGIGFPNTLVYCVLYCAVVLAIITMEPFFLRGIRYILFLRLQ